jgi:hypothetical protein
MNAINLTVEVHCIDPVEQNNYRLYINDDLLTERTWIWDSKTLINENIWIVMPNNNNNIARIEIISQSNSIAQFSLRNLQIVNQTFNVEQINEHTISFTLQ